MAEKYELDRWAAVVCNGFTAVNVMSSGNVEELGWDYTEMELDPTGTCGLFDGMLLDWDDDTPAERRDHEAYFPDAFTVGARILADDWDHELGNDEVRSRCFAIIEDIPRRSPRSLRRRSPIPPTSDAARVSRPVLPSATVSMAAGSNCKGNTMADRDAKRKRPITCLETGVTFESAYRAAKELGFADSRNIFRSIQRGTCTQGLHFYYADAPKPSPGFFLPPNRPPRPVVCLDTGETFESAFQAGRAFGIAAGAVRTSASTGVERNGLHFYYGDEPKPGPEFFRERHSKTRPIVCLETGETFDGNPAAARPLHVSPAAISQAVRYGTPVAGLHFYHGDEPKPAPEFFKPIKPERGKSPMQMAAAARAAAGNPGRPDGGQRPRRAV